VIEILPYSHAAHTVDVDSATYPYLAGNGIACLRVDVRGCGDSEGFIDDEYSPTCLNDAHACVEWAASRKWCNGTVYLMGCSWGGIQALSCAANPPRQLKGVIAVCATDRGFEDDMHYMGGALLSDNLSWGAWLLSTIAQPPTKDASKARNEGDASAWQEEWLDRLHNVKPIHARWLTHSNGGSKYWKRNFHLADMGAPKVPILSIGGLAAGAYSNSVPRLSAAGAQSKKGNNVTAILGPWAHQLPHISPVGPQFGLLQEVLDWISSTKDRSPTTEPQFRVYAERVQTPAALAADDTPKGCWLGFKNSVTAHEAVGTLPFNLSPNQQLANINEDAPLEATKLSSKEETVKVGGAVKEGSGSAPAGLAGGRLFTFSGSPADLAVDQQVDDDKSACFDTSALTEDILVLGAPVVSIQLQDEAPHGLLIARLNAVSPIGESIRLTYGIVNLSKTNTSGAKPTVSLTMNYTSKVVSSGWKLRLAISSDYWPLVVPQFQSYTSSIIIGGAATSYLSVPAVSLSSSHVKKAFKAAEGMALPDVHVAKGEKVTPLTAGKQSCETQHKGKDLTVVREDDRGIRRMEERNGLTLQARCTEEYSLGGQKAAGHKVQWTTSLMSDPDQHADDSWKAVTKVWCDMEANEDQFVLKTRVEAMDGDKVIFSRSWSDSLSRNGI